MNECAVLTSNEIEKTKLILKVAVPLGTLLCGSAENLYRGGKNDTNTNTHVYPRGCFTSACRSSGWILKCRLEMNNNNNNNLDIEISQFTPPSRSPFSNLNPHHVSPPP